MISFKEYRTTEITEKVITHHEKNEMYMIDEILDIIKSNSLYKKKVMFRGFKGLNRNIGQITNDRDTFYGALDDTARDFIKKDLKIKNPTFATGSLNQTMLFGQGFIYIPYEKSTFYVSDKVHDVLVDVTTKNKDELKKSYVSYNIKTMKDFSDEVVIDTKGYYLVNYKNMSTDFKSKFFKPKSNIESLTYGDVYEMLKGFKSYWQWRYVNTDIHSYKEYFEAQGLKKKKS